MPTEAEAPSRSHSWTLWPVVLSRIGRLKPRKGTGPPSARAPENRGAAAGGPGSP